jgi:hypothetical protein
MKDILKPFEYLSDVTDKIDELIEAASKTRKKSEKRPLLSEAQALADAYPEHVSANGNDKKQFNPII